ncbi:MAG: helix-turn-helix transcriptional regulator [Cyclobacteriaceae bacterium]
MNTRDIPNSPSEKSNLKAEEKDLSMDQVLLKKLQETVMANLGNEQFSVEDLASAVAFSRSHLHRKLNQLTGQSISQFTREIRLKQGMDLLKKETGTVSEIAFQVGFGSNTYFIKCFHEHFGFSPGEVKRKMAEGWGSHYATSIEEVHEPKSDAKQSPLETLNPASSQQLILEIFQEMVKYKPTLEKFLMVDEDEGESVDIRLLAYQIIKNYPWPIGVEVRRLFSAVLKEPNQERYHQLQKSIYRTIKVISFLVISEIANLLHHKALKTSDIKFKIFCKCLTKPSHHDLVEMMKEAAKILKGKVEMVFIGELNTLLDDAFFLELDDWLAIPDKEHDISDTCMLLEQTLMLLLNKTAFLVSYKMVNVGTIKVKKPKHKIATFAHEFHILNSIDSEFKIHEEIMDQFSDSNAVLLMKSIKDSTQFLNLSPLIIDTHREELSGTSKSRIKRDIFLFEAFQEGHLKYAGTSATSQDDLSLLDGYEDLLAEYKYLLKLMQA